MVAIIAVLLALPVEVGLSAGLGQANALDGVVAPMLRARVGVDLIENLSLNANLLGAAGSEPELTSLGTVYRGSASFRAISGFASMRVRNAGDLQGFVEFGAGIGHLINLSADAKYGGPAMRGRGGLSLMLAGGAR
jgi:hypothetical protein